MDKLIAEKAEKWLTSNIDQETRDEIKKLQKPENEKEFTDSFYRDLEFGTGGLRGIMGVGSNRMNKYTIGMATQGLANYVKKKFEGEDLKVAIAYDCRNNSKFFAETTAAVFSANGIHVYLFESLRPTPQLSFAIRELGCHSGVVITASHNPKEYNGYKAYWNDGGQLISPHDKNVIQEVEEIKSINDVRFEKNPKLIHMLGREMDEKYLQTLERLSLDHGAIQKQKDLKIVFSAIHGTGTTLVPEILKRFGFENVHEVLDQAEPDGNFSTVIFPNPEEPEALSLALKKGKEIDADLIMATDPDADRVGIAVKNKKGEFQLLNGNQTGALLIYYLLEKWKQNHKLDGKQYIVKTIVTTNLMEVISKAYDVKCYNTLTGFKFIAALIKELEGIEEFIGGGEESYGYLIGDKVRDKDAVASCAMIAEMTAYAKEQGMTLWEMMLEMYQRFGLYKEELISITKKGKEGAEEIQEMMKELRANPPKKLGGSEVTKLIDYHKGIQVDMLSGKESKIAFPVSNVLQFLTADGSKISARPSGTEPKIKFYFSVNGELNSKADFEMAIQKLGTKIHQIKDELNLL